MDEVFFKNRSIVLLKEPVNFGFQNGSCVPVAPGKLVGVKIAEDGLKPVVQIGPEFYKKQFYVVSADFLMNVAEKSLLSSCEYLILSVDWI